MGDEWMIWGAPIESGIPDPSVWVRAKPIEGMQIPLGAALVLPWQHHQLLCGVPQGAMHVNFNMFLITHC